MKRGTRIMKLEEQGRIDDFFRSTTEQGLDVRLSEDSERIELYSRISGRLLCSISVNSFLG